MNDFYPFGYGYYSSGYGYCNSEYLEQSLKLIHEVVRREEKNELLYDYLLNIAPTQEEKEIIESIKNCKKQHNKVLRNIYKEYTSMNIKPVDEVDFQKPKCYIDGIVRALFEGLKAVEKYREINKGLQHHYHRDMIFDIINDEMKQTEKYNFIYSENMAISDCCNQGGYTLDEWEKKITPLLDKSIHESTEIILSSILVGTGCTPEEAIEKVEEWEESKGE